MEIYGEPGSYEGRISLGVVTGRIVLVEAGEGQLIVQVALQEGRLTLRLAGDVSFLSGNWVLGKRRGAVVAKRHEWQEGFARGGGPQLAGVWPELAESFRAPIRSGRGVRRSGVDGEVAAAAPLRPGAVVDRHVRVPRARHPPGEGAGAGAGSAGSHEAPSSGRLRRPRAVGRAPPDRPPGCSRGRPGPCRGGSGCPAHARPAVPPGVRFGPGEAPGRTHVDDLHVRRAERPQDVLRVPDQVRARRRRERRGRLQSAHGATGLRGTSLRHPALQAAVEHRHGVEPEVAEGPPDPARR